VDLDFVHLYSDLIAESESDSNSSGGSGCDSEDGASASDDEDKSSSDDESDLTDSDDSGISNAQTVFICDLPADATADSPCPCKHRRRGHVLWSP
jgi:hypothetical protein